MSDPETERRAKAHERLVEFLTPSGQHVHAKAPKKTLESLLDPDLQRDVCDGTLYERLLGQISRDIRTAARFNDVR
jgi:hypothetical protein